MLRGAFYNKRAEKDGMAATYLCNSSVRGYHVYQSVWSAEENLVCKWEMSNPRDNYAVIVVKGEQTCPSALAVYLLVNRTVPGTASSCWHLVPRPTRHLGSLDELRVVGYRQKAGPVGSAAGRWPLIGLQ